MSKLVDEKMTIYEALQNIETGKYVMPAFQRQYVWDMARIEKLWDSILLDYPISTFLFWHIDNNNTTWDTYFCQFLKKVTFDSRKNADEINYELTGVDTSITNIAILDGQQRLTSLYLSLLGDCFIRPNYARKKTGTILHTKLLIELDSNKIIVDEEEYNSKKFDIRFTDKVGKLSPTQFEIKNIIKPEFRDSETRPGSIESAIVNVPKDSKDYAKNILNKLCEKVYEEQLIRYTEIIDMNQDDALEMFVRFNSGGKALRKSEITMSILEAYWPSAKTEFGKILKDSYANFDTDFLIRTALMLYGNVIKSNINKDIVDQLKNNWNDFRAALKNLDELLKEFKIETSRFASGWNVLLPIIYSIYYNTDYKTTKEAIRCYLLRAILFTYFQSGTTSKLQQMKNNINNFNFEITTEMLDQISELRLSDAKIEDVITAEKGSRIAGEALYYLSLDYINKGIKYEQDHLHPDDRFNESKPLKVSMEDWKRWRTMRNQLPNLHLLAGRPNASKGEMRLVDYFNDMTSEQQSLFMKESMIPEDESLEIENFENFFNARKAILLEKVKVLLQ